MVGITQSCNYVPVARVFRTALSTKTTARRDKHPTLRNFSPTRGLSARKPPGTAPHAPDDVNKPSADKPGTARAPSLRVTPPQVKHLEHRSVLQNAAPTSWHGWRLCPVTGLQSHARLAPATLRQNRQAPKVSEPEYQVAAATERLRFLSVLAERRAFPNG